jgi:hypothetical protein
VSSNNRRGILANRTVAGRAMSTDEFLSTLNQYAFDQFVLFAIGMLVIVGLGLFLWKKLRKIEVRLDDLRREVNRLNLMEERHFLLGLDSGSDGEAKIKRAQPSNLSIVPEVADNSVAEVHSSSKSSLEREQERGQSWSQAKP